ncbi:hypothetical protein J2W56_003013 [Nocardia kruczakiae]|uniref:DUF6545 domain-containing protein n=1 Tax=Nocardia kruczakiae TaxID=261477 RepID=A0ABU1XH19_9NOCA|nr:MAB_1171c family putative transporter [Nocardia kruczakiae]MDR7169272.1 hypothetical protein [Nocardia kruczakiae]
MTSSVPVVIAWPVIVATVLVVAARWVWFDDTAAERYLNSTLTIIAATQVLREDVAQRAIVAVAPTTVTTVQQISLCTIVVSIAPFLCVIDLLSGHAAREVRNRQWRYHLIAAALSIAILAAGTRARREQRPVEVSGGWAEVLVWLAFSILPLFLAVRMIARCWSEYRQHGVTRGEKVVLAGIALAGAAIGVTTAIATGLALVQQIGVLDSVDYRLRTNSRNFFWIATVIAIVSSAPVVEALLGVVGFDATGRRWRRLRPLWESMTTMFPDSRLPMEPGSRRITRLRLHRTTVEIRDAILELRPYCADVDPAEFANFAAAERIPPRDAEPAGYALQLALAARERSRTGDPPGGAAATPVSDSATLDDEVDELLRVARWWPAATRFADRPRTLHRAAQEAENA